MVGRRERRSAVKNRLSLGAFEGLITPRRFTYYKLFNWHEVLRKRPMTNELLVFQRSFCKASVIREAQQRCHGSAAVGVKNSAGLRSGWGGRPAPPA